MEKFIQMLIHITHKWNYHDCEGIEREFNETSEIIIIYGI